MAKFLTLTDKCNLRCSFCYERALPASLTPLKQKRALRRRTLEGEAHEGWDAVVITGGEPTIMPTFFEAGKRICKAGILKDHRIQWTPF